MLKEEKNTELVFDPLDMNNYKVEKLPVREKSKFEKWMAIIGGPLAIITFVLIGFVINIPFLQNISPENLSKDALKEFNNTEKIFKIVKLNDVPEKSRSYFKEIKRKIKKSSKSPSINSVKLNVEEEIKNFNQEELNVWKSIKVKAFERSNALMLAIFIASIILWITEAVPNYLTSLILIISLVLTNVLSEVDAYHQLGHKVMWLNILSFVLASMLVKTKVAKRFALWLILRFGKNAAMIFISFIVINLVLSAFISATTAKAAILLPIFMVIAAVYGTTGGKNRNNFGRNLVLQNLFQINISASGFITGSGANLLAGALIAGAIGIDDFLYAEWSIAALPLALILILIGWIVGTKLIFPIPKEERIPQIEGGMKKLKDELNKLGPIKLEEIKSIILFLGVLALWITDSYHGISKTAVAFLGAVIALLPGIGIVKWNDVDIPWHLLLFSAGAYTLGAGLNVTDLASISVNALFNSLGFGEGTPFWLLYLILTAAMIFSSLIFQSKTMRTLIFIPIAIGVAQRFGFSIMSLAFPVALLIEHVYALPFNSKPAALLYVTDHYSWSDTLKYGVTMLIISWIMIIIWGETWLRFLGHTPNGVFGIL
ncbi:MAG: DASS family sodium-coupled anion symporter [Bacteroidales bacterium]|nr:DASS family sodium-coupled anion symporter [Bacteroidales bacterium]MBN2756446.1 DASS family sodium-coupled anion symporter [Bacteroidales bacterium]